MVLVCATLLVSHQHSSLQWTYIASLLNMLVYLGDRSTETITEDLRYADDATLTAENIEDTEHQLNAVNAESFKVSLQISRAKTNKQTNKQQQQ